MTSSLLLDEKRRIIVDGSVTRYGPRISCQRKELTAIYNEWL